MLLDGLDVRTVGIGPIRDPYALSADHGALVVLEDQRACIEAAVEFGVPCERGGVALDLIAWD